MRPAAPRRRPSRPGFTVTELVVAASVFALLAGFALPFITGQPKLVAAAAARGDAAQSARFAQTTIDRELRMIGANTLPSQPMLVYADGFAVTFNADLLSNDADDVFAAGYNPDADTSTVSALQPPAMTLPRGGFTYPQAPMLASTNVAGAAETISYWVSPDSSTSEPNDYVLWRKVNRATALPVTTGVYVPAGRTFFQYFWVRDSTGAVDSVRTAQLPLRHLSPLHASSADTGENARIASQIDRVRSVRISAIVQYRDPRRGGAPGTRTATSTTTMINVAALRRSSCGTAPDASVVTATPVLSNGQIDYVRLTWTAVTDDGSGERDVHRYHIYRSENAAPVGLPLDDVPAVNVAGSTYTYRDYDVRRSPRGAQTPASTNSFAYGVSAQDCQPQSAPLTMGTPVNVQVIP